MKYHPHIEINAQLSGVLMNIYGSEVHLAKTIANLVANAAESMPNGGTVSIFTESRYIDRPVKGYDQIKEGDYATVTIADTGIGIAEDDLARIFEPFYSKKVMGRSGTGLGLSVVWGTVQDHHGYITVDSTPGKGSTFSLYFPLTREEPVSEHPAESLEGIRGNKEVILIIDDVKEQRDIAAIFLSKLGYSPIAVASGDEAIAYMQNHTADLLLLDMIMRPGIDGLDTYQGILKLHPRQKAIIVSGFSESENVKRTQNLGAGAYLKKPYTIEMLGRAVQAELKKK